MNNEFTELTEQIDFGNIEQMAKDCWLFLTNDNMPDKAEIKKEAFLHEVQAVIESCRQHYAKQKVEHVVTVYQEYNSLLGEELEELIGVAHAYGAHGWRSSRIEKGKELREKISSLNV